MKPRFRVAKRSLGWTVVVGMLVGELVFAVALGFTMGAFSLISVATQHEEAREQVAGTIAAALMPIIADQQESRVANTLESVVRAADLQDIKCICIVDSSGATIASHGESAACPRTTYQQSSSPWSVFTEDELVRQPVIVNDLEVATAYVRFAPIPLAQALRTPAIASLLVVVSIMFISVPWTAWFVVRDITEPLRQLDTDAARIADGEYDIEVEHEAPGEIGTLQHTVERVATQLKERPRELGESYDQLSNAYESLAQAKQQVEELATMKANFVAVAAHEIRTPLSTISLYSERLAAGEITDLDAAGTEAIAAIHSAASRLGGITSDLMDSALLERGLMTLQFAPVWLADLVEDAARDAGQVARIGAQTINVQDDLPEMIVRGDALRLRQVLDNLLSNALKYSPPGSPIEIRAADGEERVAIEVVDQGRGVADADADRLFTLFGRLDFGESREIAGLGLGLAISARIVEAHGGTISFRANEAGRGSIFTIELPKSGLLDGPSSHARLGDEESGEEK